MTLAASVVAQKKMDHVRVLGRGTRSKSKRYSPPCLLHVWSGGQGQRQVIVLKIMSHAFGKTITDHGLGTEIL